MTHIGFTGTRSGCTPQQWAALENVFRSMATTWRETGTEVTLHHGDCVGADVQAHSLARLEGWRTVGHPCNLVAMRARCRCDELRPTKPPLDRNRDIVDASSLLIACPAGPEEVRSGTWATVRHARKKGKPLVIVWPDGNVTREEAAP